MLKQISNKTELNINKTLSEDNLTMSQAEVLLILNEAEENTCSFTDLRKLLEISQPTCFGIVHRLEEKGMVTLATPEWNHKIKLVTLTAQGRKQCISIARKFEVAEEKLLGNLTDKERQSFIKLTHKVYKNYCHPDCS